MGCHRHRVKLALVRSDEGNTEGPLRRLRLARDSLPAMRTLAQSRTRVRFRCQGRALLGSLIVAHDAVDLPFTQTELGKPIPMAVALERVHGPTACLEETLKSG